MGNIEKAASLNILEIRVRSHIFRKDQLIVQKPLRHLGVDAKITAQKVGTKNFNDYFIYYMNQTKISKVDILYQRNNQAILEMPKDYRKGHFMIRKNEIKIEKEEVQPPKKKDADQNIPKDYYQQRKKNILIIKDDREKQPYQSQKFLDDLPQAQSLILFKNRDKYSLNFVSQKSEVYKHMTEEFQNKIFKDIDKGLDARKNQENRDKVDIRVKKQIAGYDDDVLSGSDIEDPFSGKKKQAKKNKKEKVQHKLDYQSDDEKPKKKVKKDESSDDELSSDYVQDSSDS